MNPPMSLHHPTADDPAPASATPFLGLAPFLRMSIAGTDLRPVCADLLAQAQVREDDANLWMNLSIAMLSLGQRDLGLAIQAQALSLQPVFDLPAARQPARARVLMLMAPGDLAANTPLECLLEEADVDLIFYYLAPGAQVDGEVPDHDVLLVGPTDSAENQGLLDELAACLGSWPRPVINRPWAIRNTDRARASTLLQGVPGLAIPMTFQVSRGDLEAVAAGTTTLPALVDDCDFPVILRPVGSQAGRDLERIPGPADLAAYLARVAGPDFFISRFMDYRSEDGLFRKFRLALVDGQAFACHMGVSVHWMIHYVNAGMYDDSRKREEEARFMATFPDFARRHQGVLTAIAQRIGLDYLCIDCAETRDGELLVFEVGNAMVTHAMDPVDLFPYKPPHMQKLKDAFREYLFRLAPRPGVPA